MAQINLALPDVVEPSVDHALQELVDAIKLDPIFVRFMEAYQAVRADDQAQRLLDEALTLQQQMRFDYSEERAVQFDELLAQLDRLPAFVAYQRAEEELPALLRAVDAVISKAAGVAFAANARRSCCGG